MRKDMHKVLTERPRAGGRGWHTRAAQEKAETDRLRPGRYKQQPEGDYEDLQDERPLRQGMRKPYRLERKEFSDLLNPLIRYLRKQVGRPWNKVWSEICAVLKGSGLQADHVKGHVRSEVDGIPFSGDKYFQGEVGKPNSVHYPFNQDQLYVNHAGILCLKRHRKKNKKAR